MKKLLAVLLSVFFLTTTSAMAEIGVGITASFASIDSDGKEVELTGDTETTTGSIEEDVEVVEFFAEIIGENGLTIGASYVPTRSLGSKTRTDVDGDDAAENDNGDYVAKAELDNVYMIYTDIPVGPVYVKLGFQHATINTLESLNSGSTYADQDVNGWTYGLGYKNDTGFMNTYYKAEISMTDFADYKKTNNNNTHKVEANTDIVALKLSLGAKF